MDILRTCLCSLEVMAALGSYQDVRRRNENKAADHATLRRQMIESQSDPQKVVESLATNMGFWLLGQTGERASMHHKLGGGGEGGEGGGGGGGEDGEGEDLMGKALSALAAAHYRAKEEAGWVAEGVGGSDVGGGGGDMSDTAAITSTLKCKVAGKEEIRVEELRKLLAASDAEK